MDKCISIQDKTFLPECFPFPGSQHQKSLAFVQNLPWITQSEVLLERFKDLLLSDFQIRSLQLILIDEAMDMQGLYLAHPREPFRLISGFQSSSPVIHLFSVNRPGYLDIDAGDPPASNGSDTALEAKQKLSAFFPGTKLCFPLIAGGSLAGMLLLGSKAGEAPYTDSDRQWLFALTKEVSSALERIMGIDELALLGGLSAGIAHDLQNLLTPLSTLLQLYKEANRGSPEEEGLLALSRKNIDTIQGYIRHALHLSVPPKPQREVLRLDQLLREVIVLSEEKREKKKLKVSFQPSGEFKVHGDRIFILRLIGNLLDNAIKASPPGALLSLQLREEDEWIRLRFQDEGAGFAPEVRKQIFLRTFKIGETEEGKSEPGLGLAICRRIASLHAGKIIIKNEGKGGARVDLLLPVYRKAASQRSK